MHACRPWTRKPTGTLITVGGERVLVDQAHWPQVRFALEATEGQPVESIFEAVKRMLLLPFE